MPSIRACSIWPLKRRKQGMLAYSRFQEEEFCFGKEDGYMATTHQRFGGYFDRLMGAITAGDTSVKAMTDSTQEEQFK